MDAVNKFLKGTLMRFKGLFGDDIQGIRPPLICKDGFSISVQASRFNCCEPREDGDVIYESVELGFPDMEDELIAKYAEDPDDLLHTFYDYVPVAIVNQLIEKHGGILGNNEEET